VIYRERVLGSERSTGWLKEKWGCVDASCFLRLVSEADLPILATGLQSTPKYVP
jgi:hypothetical protein